MTNTYTIIYRTGGTANFRWHRVLERYATRHAASPVQDELERAGYLTRCHVTRQLDAIGLPETFE